MSYSSSTPRAPGPAVQMETLEGRRLLAAVPADIEWGRIPQLIGQDRAAAQFADLTGAGTAVAVIDTGIDYTHEHLGGGFGPGNKVVGGWDFVDNDADPMDTYGHGTRVAGVIGADPFEFEGRRYQGVAHGANLLALRVDAADDPVPDERIEKALRWVLDHQAQYNIVAANISFGSGHYAKAHTSLYSDELSLLRQRRVVVVASSGNDGISDDEPFGIEYPAADRSVLSVGSVDSFDVISEFTERASNLDLLAPGDGVPTTSLLPDPFITASGTSFAAPFVAGTIALMRDANPGLRPADIDSIFHAGSSDNFDGDAEFGTVTKLTFPRLDVHKAVSLAGARRPGSLARGPVVATAGNGNDLAYDRDGVLHIVYYDSIQRNLKYLVRSNGLELSTPKVIDSTGNDVGGYLSLALDSHGRPAVAYFDGTAGDLKFARFDGAAWKIQTLDAPGSVGLYPSLVYDGADNPVVSYFHKTRGDLRVARFSGEKWNIHTVDSRGVVGRSTDLAYNPETDELALAYEDSTLGRLMMARNRAGDGWTRGLVDNARTGVTHISVAYAPDDRPAVSYYDIHNADLKYASFDGALWSHQRLANRGAQGLYTQLHFTKDGQASIIYYNRHNNFVAKLTGAGKANSPWRSAVLQSGGGRYIAAACKPGDDAVTYSWFQPGAAKLRINEA